MLLVGLALGAVVDWMGIEYDSSGVGLILFYSSLLLAFPVWIAHELLSSVEFLRTLYVSKWIAAALALVIAIGFDYALAAARRGFSRRN
jgi:hypothetical protein